MKIFANSQEISTKQDGPLAGFNLLPVSSFCDSSQEILQAYGWDGTFNHIEFTEDGVTLNAQGFSERVDLLYALSNNVTPNTTYTFSLSMVWGNGFSGQFFFVEKDKNGNAFGGELYQDHVVALKNDWKRKANTVTFTTSDNSNLASAAIYIRAMPGTVMKIRNAKLEYGDTSTIWTPASGDTEKMYQLLKQK